MTTFHLQGVHFLSTTNAACRKLINFKSRQVKRKLGCE